MTTKNGTKGRVYGGDPDLVHVPDGERKHSGEELADLANRGIRGAAALAALGSSIEELRVGNAPDLTVEIFDEISAKQLCPDCYMVVLFNTAVELALKNNQSLVELGNTMSAAFAKLAETAVENKNGKGAFTEEINVILDPHE